MESKIINKIYKSKEEAIAENGSEVIRVTSIVNSFFNLPIEDEQVLELKECESNCWKYIKKV